MFQYKGGKVTPFAFYGIGGEGYQEGLSPARRVAGKVGGLSATFVSVRRASRSRR